LIGRFLLRLFYQVGFSNESDQKTISFHVPVFLLQAEPLAEDPAPEVLQGAAMCTSGLFLPGHLKNGNLQQNVLTTIFVRNLPTLAQVPVEKASTQLCFVWGYPLQMSTQPRLG
jgi:hypothetical protein